MGTMRAIQLTAIRISPIFQYISTPFPKGVFIIHVRGGQENLNSVAESYIPPPHVNNEHSLMFI